MPYIAQERRFKLIERIRSLARDAQFAGELNYILFAIVREYVDKYEPSYAILNEIMGVLESA